jgi:hypothetical protein
MMNNDASALRAALVHHCTKALVYCVKPIIHCTRLGLGSDWIFVVFGHWLGDVDLFGVHYIAIWALLVQVGELDGAPVILWHDLLVIETSSKVNGTVEQQTWEAQSMTSKTCLNKIGCQRHIARKDGAKPACSKRRRNFGSMQADDRDMEIRAVCHLSQPSQPSPSGGRTTVICDSATYAVALFTGSCEVHVLQGISLEYP